MDFTFTEEQDAVRDLAAQILEGHATVERVKEVERGDERVDRELWRALADAGLLAIAVPEEHGGSGLGLIELCLLLEQQGRRVAPVPLWPTLVLGALPIAELGTPAQQREWLPRVASGDVVLTAALAEPGANDPLHPQVTATRHGDMWRLDGTKPSVPAAQSRTGCSSRPRPTTVGWACSSSTRPRRASSARWRPRPTARRWRISRSPRPRPSSSATALPERRRGCSTGP